jgi:c-di-GMP-binding flagellar brake protein YcgR
MPNRTRTEMLERRKYARVDKEHLLKCEQYCQVTGDLKHSVKATTANMSSGGFLIKSEKEHHLGDTLKMEVVLPGWDKYDPDVHGVVAVATPVMVTAKIVRVEELADETYEIGVRITGVDDVHRLALERYIYDHVKAE